MWELLPLLLVLKVVIELVAMVEVMAVVVTPLFNPELIRMQVLLYTKANKIQMLVISWLHSQHRAVGIHFGQRLLQKRFTQAVEFFQTFFYSRYDKYDF